jgi:hypothetical protein
MNQTIASGVAVSGGLLSVVTMISQVARVEVRATVFGSFAAVAAVSSVAGPILGGQLQYGGKFNSSLTRVHNQASSQIDTVGGGAFG